MASRKTLPELSAIVVSPSNLSKRTTPGIILLRYLFFMGLVLALVSWTCHGFAMLSNDRLVLEHAISEYDGVPIKWSYSGVMDSSASQGTPPQLDKSITKNPLNVARQTYEKGIGTFSPSKIVFNLNGGIKRFYCLVGVEGDNDDGRVTIFRIFADGKKIYESPPMLKKMNPQTVDLDVSGIKDLCLEADPYNYELLPDYADWLNIQMDCEQKKLF